MSTRTKRRATLASQASGEPNGATTSARRTSKRQRVTQVKGLSESDGSDDDGVDLSALSKEERRRYKNRQSAAQSRMRKREEMQRLLQQVANLKKKVASGQSKVRSLQNQVSRQKGTIAELETNVATLTAELEASRRAAAMYSVAANSNLSFDNPMLDSDTAHWHALKIPGTMAGGGGSSGGGSSGGGSGEPGRRNNGGKVFHDRHSRHRRPVSAHRSSMHSAAAPAGAAVSPSNGNGQGGAVQKPQSGSGSSEHPSSLPESIGSFPIGNLTAGGDSVPSASHGMPTMLIPTSEHSVGSGRGPMGLDTRALSVDGLSAPGSSGLPSYVLDSMLLER